MKAMYTVAQKKIEPESHTVAVFLTVNFRSTSLLYLLQHFNLCLTCQTRIINARTTFFQNQCTFRLSSTLPDPAHVHVVNHWLDQTTFGHYLEALLHHKRQPVKHVNKPNRLSKNVSSKLTLTVKSAETGRWSLIIIWGWLLYESWWTWHDAPCMCNIRSVHPGLRLKKNIIEMKVKEFDRLSWL